MCVSDCYIYIYICVKRQYLIGRQDVTHMLCKILGFRKTKPSTPEIQAVFGVCVAYVRSKYVIIFTYYVWQAFVKKRAHLLARLGLLPGSICIKSNDDIIKQVETNQQLYLRQRTMAHHHHHSVVICV